MKKLLVALSLWALSLPALAQNFTMPPPGGVYVIGMTVVSACGTPGAVLVAGKPAFATMDTNGILCTTAGGGGGGSVTQGTVPWADNITQWGSTAVVNGGVAGSVGIGGQQASGSAAAGNPVPVAGSFNSTMANLTNGQRSDLQQAANGALVAVLTGTTSTGALAAIGGAVTNADANAVSGANLALKNVSYPLNFNGATWDRQFTCPSTAVVSVTAGTTGTIVGLSGSTVIRVCSIAITASLAGTATFEYGTGTNCATGTTGLSGAMSIGTTNPLAISAGNGSLMRTAAANSLCVVAVTGNMTGFISYAQY